MFPRLGDNLASTIQITQLPFLSSIHCEALAWLWWYFDLGVKALERMHQLTSGPVWSRLALTMSTWLKCCQWKNKVFSKFTLLACLLMLSCCFRIILTLDTSRLQSWWEFLQKLDSGRSQPLRLQMPDRKRSDCSSCSTQIHKPEIRFDINMNHTGGYRTVDTGIVDRNGIFSTISLNQMGWYWTAPSPSRFPGHLLCCPPLPGHSQEPGSIHDLLNNFVQLSNKSDTSSKLFSLLEISNVPPLALPWCSKCNFAY